MYRLLCLTKLSWTSVEKSFFFFSLRCWQVKSFQLRGQTQTLMWGRALFRGFFLLTLPQWGLCDLIPIPPTPLSFEHSNTAVDGVQLAMTPKPQSVLRLRHRQGLTATVKQTSLCLKSLSVLAGYSIAVHIGLLCLTPLCYVQLHSWTNMMFTSPPMTMLIKSGRSSLCDFELIVAWSFSEASTPFAQGGNWLYHCFHRKM